jgi:hypothetical protein
MTRKEALDAAAQSERERILERAAEVVRAEMRIRQYSRHVDIGPGNR